MLRRLLVLIVLAGLLSPVAAGAHSPDMDPDGTPAARTSSDPTADPQHSPDMDPDGLRAPAPPGVFTAWLQQLVRQLFGWVL